MGIRRLLPLAFVLLVVGCAQRDYSLVGKWEAFTETHRDASLELRKNGSAEFRMLTWVEGKRNRSEPTVLAGRWATKDDVVIVKLSEGEAQYRYSPNTRFPGEIEPLYRGLTPIAGHELVGHDILFNPPLMQQGNKK